MKFAEAELRQITQDNWKIVLGEELEPCSWTPAPGDIADWIAATAQIAGDWQLTLVFYGSSAMARRAASVIFDLGAAQPQLEDVQDTICELANIVAGNIKGVLSGSSHLSLPTLMRGDDFELMFPRHVLLSEASFSYASEPVVVELLGEDQSPTQRERTGVMAA